MTRKTVIAFTFALTTACASEPGGPGGSGGDGATTSGGGLTGTGGPGSGATTGSGGNLTGGAPGTGGAPAAGGAPGTGGLAGIGGVGGAATGGLGGGTGTGGGGTETGGAGTGGMTAQREWLPAWATTIQTVEEKNLPGEPPLGAGCNEACKSAFSGNTLRQFVWPTYSGSQIRLRLSNEKGKSPLEIQKVHVALAQDTSDALANAGNIDAATDTAITFGGMAKVTIPAGETIWSDPTDFALEKLRLTAVTMQLGTTIPNEITGHPGARTLSYFPPGDGVTQPSVPQGTTSIERWYFIDDIEVMAPSGAAAIAVLGDSISDGYGIHGLFQRWPDFLTSAVQNDPMLVDTVSVLNFGMGANMLTEPDGYQDAGKDRFVRDVLGRDKIKWLIVLEGVNDITFGVQAQPIIDAYEEIIMQAHDKGIEVFGSPITPMGTSNGVRDAVNASVRGDGYFDAIIDFDAALDPDHTQSIKAGWHDPAENLHPNAVGYEVMGNAVDLSLFYP